MNCVNKDWVERGFYLKGFNIIFPLPERVHYVPLSATPDQKREYLIKESQIKFPFGVGKSLAEGSTKK